MSRKRWEEEGGSELSESLDDDGQLDTESDSLSRDLRTLFLITREAYSREFGEGLVDMDPPGRDVGMM